MWPRLARLRRRHPLLVPVLALGCTIALERVAFQLAKNLLPPIREELGEAASYLPFATSAGGLLGFLVWLLAGTLGAGRRWAIAFLAGLVAAGALATYAPGPAVLLAAAALAGLTGFGGSVLLSAACERLGSDSRRRDLNHRVNTVAELVAPALVAGVTLLAAGGSWRHAMAVGAMALPALALGPLLGVHFADRPRSAGPRRRVRLDGVLKEIRTHLRDRAIVLGALAAAATSMALVPFGALLALAVHDDGIGLDVVAVITLLGLPTVLVGHVWERLLGLRPRAALAASYGPAFAAWAIVLVLETCGAAWGEGVRVLLWGAAAVAIRLALFATALVARGLVLSIGDGTLPAGAVSVRSALQALPSAAAGALALLAAPPLYRLGHGLALVALAGLGLLIGAVLTMHRAHT